MKIVRIIFLIIYLNGTAGYGKMVPECLNPIYFDPNLNISCFADTITAPAIKISPFQLEIVPPSSGVKFYNNGIIFLSSSIKEGKMVQKHLSFGSAVSYFATVNDSVPEQFRLFAPELSFTFPTDATTFSNNYDTIYYTRIPSKGRKEQIFMAAYSGSKWIGENTTLNFCNEEYVFTHPALSSDGTFIIFSSDMPGTSGGLDLFLSRRVDDGWGEPVNLGPNLNTAGNELYASLDKENNLYYSSDGLPGEGGYDIFSCRYSGNGWEAPRNISSDINSKHDEIAFTLNRMDDNSAFYTSRLRTGKQAVQLCRVTMDSEVNSKDNLTALLLAVPGTEQMKEMTASAKEEDVKQTQAIDNVIQEDPGYQASEIIAAVPDEQLVTDINSRKDSPVLERDAASKNVKLVYRVQILASTKPAGSRQININGRQYQSWEYLHMGGYRTTVGEFGTLAEATDFQNICRKNGYNQAFIAAFSNNMRISDAEARAIESEIRDGSDKQKMPATETVITSEPVKASDSARTAKGPDLQRDDVIYRVQILANTKSVGSYIISISGHNYSTYEYLHAGGFRTAIGEFSNLQDAIELQNKCRKSGYEQAFVVAFKNGVRSTDQSLFRK